MSFKPLTPAELPTPFVGNSVDYRAAVQRAQEERTQQRDRELAAQASPLNEPQERIRIWERLHALRLPLAPEHKLVRVIATQTELTVLQVREEQQRRLDSARGIGS
jgi:hypothetical protein